MKKKVKNPDYVVKRFNLKIYPNPITFVIDISENGEAEKFYQSKFPAPQGSEWMTLGKFDGLTTNLDGKIGVLIRLKSGGETVVHECTHVVCDVLETCGVKFDLRNQEILAYPMGVLCRMVFNFMHDCREKYK